MTDILPDAAVGLWWTERVISARRRWFAGAALVTLGWLASPSPVPVYDGVSAPDEPYRYVQPPQGTTKTADPTTASSTTPVKDGRGTNGLSVATGEVGPQFSLFLPPQAMAAAGTITVSATPQAPADQPAGAAIDGNVYVVAITSTAGPVTLTEKASIATVYLRATSTRQPPPTLEYRPAADQPWQALKTSRGGQDFYVGRFPGAGQFAVAFAAKSTGGGSSPVLPLVAVGVLVLLVVVVLVVRLRAAPE